VLREELLKSIFPIIQLDEKNKRYDIAGSAVLVEYNKQKFLLTAGHVLQKNGIKYPLYLFLEKETIKLNGPAFVQENIDLSIFDLRTDKKLNESLKYLIPLKIQQNSANTTNNINYLVYGFPHRKGYFNKVTSIFKIKPIIYLTKESEINVYSTLSVDNKNFRIVNYNQKKSKDEEGNKTTVCIPQGASGGGLIKVYSNNKQELVSFELDGILIEWRNKKYIVATRTCEIIKTIEESINFLKPTKV